ncbi:MAG: hypothetical protein FJ138_09660 [Deltaproteobacteria bacterium]|nr:hypothetical protein [Deltaproteobacteria bacterium]
MEGIPGLVEVDGEGAGALEDPEALRFLVALYEETRPLLAAVLARREADRAFIDERARACYALNERLGLTIDDPRYHTVIGLQDEEGRVVMGPLQEGYCRAGGAPVAPLPAHLRGSHVTLFGPPDSAKLSINAMNAYHRQLADEPEVVRELLAALPPEAASPKWGADDEDSKTPLRADLVSAARNLAGCFEGSLSLEEERPDGAVRRYALAADHLALPIKRFPGLALPCPFLFYEGSPLPLHLYDLALHLYAHRARPEALVFYVPKLETEEEAAYLRAVLAAAEERVAAVTPGYARGSVRLMVVLENPRVILRVHELMDALHPYFAGASLGWHDFLASTARLFKEDPNYRIPVKADPDIVIKYIQASHRLVADVVGSRGGVTVGGMYGVLPTSTDLRSPSFQVTLLGYFKDVVTQLKRGLSGFWVAHPDFVRLGLALVQAWRLRAAGDPAPLRRLCRDVLLPPYAEEAERFVEGEDVRGLTPGEPGYERALIVADLRESDTVPNHDLEEVRYNVFQSLQYLVDWLSGNGCVALPAEVRGTPVRVMDDLATAERSRWEVWAEVRHGRVSREDLARVAFEELRFIRQDLSDGRKLVQVKWDERTARWYPVAFELMMLLMTAEEPPEFATELLLPFTLRAVRDAADPLAEARRLAPGRYELDPYTRRFCDAFELCGAARFAREAAARPAWDEGAMRAAVMGFSKDEVIEAASFHGDIGQPRRGLDAHAAAEQARVFEEQRETLDALAALGAEYRARYGFKFLVSARGRGGAELLAALRARLGRPEGEELRAAREALWEIAATRLRLTPPSAARALADGLEALRRRAGVRAAGVAICEGGRVQALGLGCGAEARFEVASLSKTVGALCALRLAERRGLSLDEPVNDLLARLGSPLRLRAAEGGDPAWAGRVTLAHLMSHQGLSQHYVQGWPLSEPPPPVLELIEGTSERARARGYLGVRVVSDPGTRFGYSGGGFLVLEHLVALLAGRPAAEEGEALARDLGAAGLTLDGSGARLPAGAEVADGFLDGGARVPGGRLVFPGFAAGALASAADVARLLVGLERAYWDLDGAGGLSHDAAARALYGRDLGCREFMACDAGLGVFVTEAGDNRLMLHQGSNEGYRALYLHCFAGPDRGKGLVVLCNADQSGVPFVAEAAGLILGALGVRGVDHAALAARRAAGWDPSSLPAEQRVNLGYRDLLLSAFEPRLPPPTARGAVPEEEPLSARNLVVGAALLRVSNQRFARAENLISPHRPTFDPTLYCAQGKVMDSWESARHNPRPEEHVELRLARPGRVRWVSLSTEYHDGNHPEGARLLGRAGGGAWEEVTPRLALKGHARLRVDLGAHAGPFDELRVEMWPDGGLSRLGVYEALSAEEAALFAPLDRAAPERFARPIPKPRKPLTVPFHPTPGLPARDGGRVDLACLASGGRVLGVTNEHYGPASQVLSPLPPLHMFDGFESARSRAPGHFEVLELALGAEARLESMELDFTHFVNNNPRALRVLAWVGEAWEEVAPRVDVKPFAANRLRLPLRGAVSGRLRVEVFPDGGINRVRVYGA